MEELFYDRAGNCSRRMADGAEEIYRYDPRNRLTEYTCPEAQEQMRRAIRDRLNIQNMDASVANQLSNWYENKRSHSWLRDAKKELARQIGLDTECGTNSVTYQTYTKKSKDWEGIFW